MESLFFDSLFSLLEGETDTIANMANTAALLYETLENVNWVGFYRMKDNELLLGPFMGKVACVHLPLNKGVCAHAATTKKTIRVDDVHQFATHIACDSATNSEIVVPLMKEGKVLGVLDIDSPLLNRFNEQDEKNLKRVVEILLPHIESV